MFSDSLLTHLLLFYLQFPSSDFLEKENSDNITNSNGINHLNTSNQTNQSDRQKPSIIQASNSFSNHFTHYPTYNRSSQSNFSQSDHDSFTNNTSTTHDYLNSTDRNLTSEAGDNLNTNSHDVHQEPPVHIPERDYPEDDDSLSSTESDTTHSTPADNYKSHQINPDNYEPPDLPPDTISGKRGVRDLILMKKLRQFSISKSKVFWVIFSKAFTKTL